MVVDFVLILSFIVLLTFINFGLLKTLSDIVSITVVLLENFCRMVKLIVMDDIFVSSMAEDFTLQIKVPQKGRRISISVENTENPY